VNALRELVDHLGLAWRLFWDPQVPSWRKLVFAVPLLYLAIPLRYDVLLDILPVVGLIDDWLLALLSTYVFVLICPRSAVRRHRSAILLGHPDPQVRRDVLADPRVGPYLSERDRLEMYRDAREPMAMAAIGAVFVGIALLGGIVAWILLVLGVGGSWLSTSLLRARILRQAEAASEIRYPKLALALERCWKRLPRVSIEIYVVPSDSANAYTFGMDEPYVLVVSSRLIEALHVDELAAAVAHELGHMLYEHTFVSSLLGGMLYPTGPVGWAWALAFTHWRRLAELSADRLSLLVCQDLRTCVGALVRGERPRGGSAGEIDAVLARASDAERGGELDDSGVFAFHPSLVSRVRSLIRFDAELLALDVETWLTGTTQGPPRQES